MADPQPKSPSLLILDDDQFLLNMYALKFKNSGFAIDTANNATAALQKLRDGYSPDIILCDLIMPTVDGLEFIKRMRDERLSPASSVLVLTNTSQSADIERAKSLGVEGYIVKATATPSEVVQEVKSILAKKTK
jgi:CheY-like chemotaxis protein